MNHRQIRSIYGSPYEKYFNNGSPCPEGDLLSGGIGYPTYRNDWWDTRNLWSKPYYVLSMMIGDGIGSYHNENGFTCELSSNTFFLTFPELKASYSPADGARWGELFASFSGGLFELIRHQGILNPAQPVWRIDPLQPWVERLQEIVQAPLPRTTLQTMRRAATFLDLLLELLDKAEPVKTDKPQSDWFAIACKMLTGNLHHKADLESIATELGMSYHAFRANFAKRAGMGPMRYRDEARLKKACNYLVNNAHKTCKEIAFDLGYFDSHHFSEHFKRHLKMSPSKYRKLHQNKVQ